MEQTSKPEWSASDDHLILKKKTELMQIWCATFFNNDHRCILGYLVANTLQNKPVSLEDLNVFRNSNLLISDLEAGFLVNVIEKKVDRETKKEVKINMGFFKKLGDLLSKIKEKINPDIEKVKSFNSATKKKICKHCQMQFTQGELQFMELKCHCGKAAFQKVVEDKPKSERLKKVQSMINEVMKKKDEILKMEMEEERKKKMKMQESAQERESELDRFMSDIRRDLKNRRIEVPRIDKDYRVILMADEKYAPKKRFRVVEEMELLEQSRKLLKRE